MAQQHLNVGTTANDGTGDTLRASQIKAESNFNELYARPDFTDAPSDGNIYGRKDATWEQVTGGSGTTPTLQEVVIEGNEIINTAGNSKIVLDKELNGMFLYELVSGTWEFRGQYNTQGFNVGGWGGFVSFDVNIFTGVLTISQGTDVVQFSPISATKNGVEFATINDIPTTATDLDALKRDGSNANSDVNIGENRIIAGKLVTKKNAGASEMELNGTYLTTNHVAEWQDKDYTGVADITDIPDVSGKEDTSNKSSSYTSSSTTTYANTKALVDGLATKQPLLSYTPFKFIQTSQTAHTGTTAETIVATATINGSTFNSSDVMKMLYGLNKGTTTSGASIRIKINTSNTLTGATQIGIFNVTGTASVTNFKRNFMLNGGNLYGLNFASTPFVNDEVNNATTYSNTSYNTANTLYLFFTIQLITSGDSMTPNLCNLSN